MALFGKLFEKKECAICGGEIGLLGNRKLEDGNCCKNCAAKLSPWFSDRRQSTVEEIKEQLAYREANQEKVAAFRVTRTLGEGMKVLLDEDDGRFMVTSARNWQEANPDVLSFSDVTGCKLDIDESKTEIQYKDAEGKRQSFSPRRYAFSYDFYIVINVNNPYFNEIRFKLNGSSVDNDEETLLDGPDAQPCVRGGGLRTGGAGPIRPGMPGGSRPGARPFMGGSRTSNADEVRSSMEYRQYEEMGREIRDALLQVREQVRNEAVAAAAPKTALTCPFCGATTTPDASGCCEFCGGAVNGWNMYTTQRSMMMMKKLSKTLALLLALTMVLCLAACGGSKDALSGTWSADLGDDGVITWTFDGKGKCTMENSYMKQKGTYTIDGDQLTVTLESWSDPSTYTFSVDGSSLTMNENSGYGISGTFAKK